MPPLPVKLIGWPTQTGLLLVTVGVGNGLTVTEAVTIFEQVPAVATKE